MAKMNGKSAAAAGKRSGGKIFSVIKKNENVARNDIWDWKNALQKAAGRAEFAKQERHVRETVNAGCYVYALTSND
jgi:hypothetical protein